MECLLHCRCLYLDDVTAFHVESHICVMSMLQQEGHGALIFGVIDVAMFRSANLKSTLFTLCTKRGHSLCGKMRQLHTSTIHSFLCVHVVCVCSTMNTHNATPP